MQGPLHMALPSASPMLLQPPVTPKGLRHPHLRPSLHHDGHAPMAAVMEPSCGALRTPLEGACCALRAAACSTARQSSSSCARCATSRRRSCARWPRRASTPSPRSWRSATSTCRASGAAACARSPLHPPLLRGPPSPLPLRPRKPCCKTQRMPGSRSQPCLAATTQGQILM